MAIDEARHEKSPSRINLPTPGDWRTANKPDSVARNSDIVRSLKYGRTVEDSRVVDYQVACIFVAGLHIQAPLPCRSFRKLSWPEAASLLFLRLVTVGLRSLRSSRGTYSIGLASGWLSFRRRARRSKHTCQMDFPSDACKSCSDRRRLQLALQPHDNAPLRINSRLHVFPPLQYLWHGDFGANRQFRMSDVLCPVIFYNLAVPR
jgi:hypothetical protein